MTSQNNNILPDETEWRYVMRTMGSLTPVFHKPTTEYDIPPGEKAEEYLDSFTQGNIPISPYQRPDELVPNPSMSGRGNVNLEMIPPTVQPNKGVDEYVGLPDTLSSRYRLEQPIHSGEEPMFENPVYPPPGTYIPNTPQEPDDFLTWGQGRGAFNDYL